MFYAEGSKDKEVNLFLKISCYTDAGANYSSDTNKILTGLHILISRDT